MAVLGLRTLLVPGVEPQALEVHTAAEHPGWVTRYETARPYPQQYLRVVYRQVEDS